MKKHLFEPISRARRASNLRTAASENERAGFPGLAGVCRELARWLDPPEVKLTATVEKPARRKGPAEAPQVKPSVPQLRGPARVTRVASKRPGVTRGAA